MIRTRWIANLALLVSCALVVSEGPARVVPADPCARLTPGSALPEPADLRSVNGVLKVQLSIRNFREPNGSMRYCYVTPEGAIAPTLRLKPGDLLVLKLVNGLNDPDAASMTGDHKHYDFAHPPMCSAKKTQSVDPCASGVMSATSTNLHFHGFSVPSVCHQDDVLKTSIQPTDAPFEYRFRIPQDEQPGLYWYHPHIHGFSSVEVSGGASGAMIIEGIEGANPDLAGLPERVLVIRDQALVNPDAPPSKSEPVVPKTLIDRDGDSANNGTGFGKPARDLSVNFVPVPYPDYPTATLKMKPGARELWRVANASAITYLNLAVIYQNRPQQLGVVAIDGAALNSRGSPGPGVTWVNHIGVPPGGRAEFIVEAPPAGVSGLFVTRTVDTGQGGENDPNRALVAIESTADAVAPRSRLPAHPEPLATSTLPWLGDVQPARVRRLFFSEKLEKPDDPNSATTFYITEEGHTPKPFDPMSSEPDIVVHQGDVEDWIIENRSTELHAFHIHQLHFQLVDWSGVPVNETFLRDTVNVPFYAGRGLTYPSVRLRMDFRDPNTVGTFVFHCHLLEHEDNGMMATIRVLPRDAGDSTSTQK